MRSNRRKIVDPNRLIKPDDEFRRGFPKLNFREVYAFQTSGEPVVITDPTYLADVYNSTEKDASFLRGNGVFVMNFGGDVSGPVWYQHPYVLLSISNHLSDYDYEPPDDVTVFAEDIGTDSGSFIFLPLTDKIPIELQHTINKVLTEKNGVTLQIPTGKWTVYYEQWETPQGSISTFYRNIVARLE